MLAFCALRQYPPAGQHESSLKDNYQGNFWPILRFNNAYIPLDTQLGLLPEWLEIVEGADTRSLGFMSCNSVSVTRCERPSPRFKVSAEALEDAFQLATCCA